MTQQEVKAVTETEKSPISPALLENDTYVTPEKPSEDSAPIKLTPWTKEWVWEIRDSMFMIVFTISLAVFTDMFIYSMIVPVVPFAFVDRMGVAPENVQSQVSIALGIFSVGMVVSALTFGYISDKIKQRQTLMMSAILIIIGCTIMICLARTTTVYFIGRFFQGLSGALVWTVGLAMIADSADANSMAFYMSFPAIATSSGMFLGPLVGGVMYERLGYYPVFYICFAILAIDLVLRIFMLEKSQPGFGAEPARPIYSFYRDGSLHECIHSPHQRV